MTTKKKKNENGNLLKDVAIGAAAIGAGLLAAKVLSDEDNRDKIKEGVKQVGEKKDEIVEKLRKEYEDVKEKVKKTSESEDVQKEIAKVADTIKKMQESNEDDIIHLADQVRSSIEKIKIELAKE